MMSSEGDKIASLRQSFDGKIAQIQALIGANKYQEAQKYLDVAEDLIAELQPLLNMSNKTHNRILKNRMIDLERLSTDINDGLGRREAGKKEDGNIAFKCNWNDAKYKDVCSQDAYLHNIKKLRPWCLVSRCRDFVGKPPPAQLKEDVCYESRALVNCFFGAGWDQDEKGQMIRPRKIWSARVNKIALLTTEPPGVFQRLLVGAFRIDKIVEDPDRETWIFGDKSTCLDDMLDYKISFWKFHMNPNSPQSQSWATGLFRYIGDAAVLGILEEYKEKKLKESGDVHKVDQLILSLKN